MSRKYTNHLIELIEEGMISKDIVILSCLKYMSEDDVRDMMHVNELWDEDQLDQDNDQEEAESEQ